MRKMMRYLSFYLKTAAKNIKRHLGLTLSASSAVSITLVLISLFTLLAYNVTSFTYSVENALSIHCEIDEIVSKAERKTIQKKIANMSGIKKVKFSSGANELAAYKKEYAKDNQLFSMYEGKNNPIRDTFNVSIYQGEKIRTINKQLKAIDGIVNVEYGGDSTTKLMQTLSMLRNGAFIFIGFFCLIAMLLIGNKIKMSIYTRKNEIAIMRFVGTSNMSIKLPMMIEGITIGVMGAIVPILITIFGYAYVYQMLDHNMNAQLIQMQPMYPLTLQVSGLLLTIAIIVGFIGSFLSTNKYLRWKR